VLDIKQHRQLGVEDSSKFKNEDKLLYFEEREWEYYREKTLRRQKAIKVQGYEQVSRYVQKYQI